MIHVITKIKRPPKDLVEQFKSIAVATVYEASSRKGFINPKIKPIFRGMKLCGPAFTVQTAPGDNIMLHKALEKAQEGDIIVATVGDEYEYGYWGDLMAIQAKTKKIGGLAIDGCVRDSEEIIEMGFPIFSRGVAIRGTVKASLGLINYPINFGGTTVNPGDLILGDDDGMVCVKLQDCIEILAKSKERVQKEEVKAKALMSGISSVEYNRLDKIFESLNLREE
ncbi:MAG TPA: 4-carboxy-4-hydroxy-2-oxoadipate aldolase/oxaloacetate decarboxylase [Candidatus Atribacteria bacterium]|nr:4-carboxy-4-hydroxy-2-oxoadipate aldolase/oxaloacetate decarboxylase [Candidatus Atribacteria bacterium]